MLVARIPANYPAQSWNQDLLVKVKHAGDEVHIIECTGTCPTVDGKVWQMQTFAITLEFVVVIVGLRSCVSSSWLRLTCEPWIRKLYCFCNLWPNTFVIKQLVKYFHAKEPVNDTWRGIGGLECVEFTASMWSASNSVVTGKLGFKCW